MIEDATTVTINGEDYVASPLNFRALEQFSPFIERVGTGSFTMKDIKEIRGIISASLRRRHPDLTDDFFLDNIDMVNAQSILAAVLAASGGQQFVNGGDTSGEA